MKNAENIIMSWQEDYETLALFKGILLTFNSQSHPTGFLMDLLCA